MLSPTARVISASRRTDIPAFYSEWLMRRIRAGFCHWINPFGGQIYRVSLRPSDVIAFVFWTRQPQPLFKYLDHLTGMGFQYYFHFTLNGYPDFLETHHPPVDRAVDAFRKLADRISPSRVHWRYDPIVISEATPPAYHVAQFAMLAERLSGYTQRCTVSFVDFYGKTRRNLRRIERQRGIRFVAPDLSGRKALVGQLRDMAAQHGITLYICCDDQLATLPGVRKAHCIDREMLERLHPEYRFDLEARPTRVDCGCVEAVDIGAYDTCVYGCAYCYATNVREAAMKRLQAHDPADSVLWRPRTLIGVDLTTRERPPSRSSARVSLKR